MGRLLAMNWKGVDLKDSEKRVNNNLELSFDECFRRFFPAVSMYMMRFLQEEELARDMTQDLFLKVWEGFQNFDSEEAVKAFLYRSARNALINYSDHEKVKKLYASREAYREQVEESFLEQVIEEETFRLVYQAIQQLPEGRQKIIMLSLKGHSNPEIVEILGVSPNTVKTQKQKAYQYLRDVLKDSFILYLIFGN